MIFLGQRSQRIACFNAMPPPAYPLLGRDIGDFGGKLLRRAPWQMQLKRSQNIISWTIVHGLSFVQLHGFTIQVILLQIRRCMNSKALNWPNFF